MRCSLKFSDLYSNIKSQIKHPIDLLLYRKNNGALQKIYIYWYYHLTLEPHNNENFSRYCLWKTCCHYEPHLYEEYEILGYEIYKLVCTDKINKMKIRKLGFKMTSLRSLLKERYSKFNYEKCLKAKKIRNTMITIPGLYLVPK